MYKGYDAYADEAGFLSHFTEVEPFAVKPVEQRSILDRFEYPGKMNLYGAAHLESTGSAFIPTAVKNPDIACSETVTDRMFLLDLEQLQALYENEALPDYYLGIETEEACEHHKGVIKYGCGYIRICI